MFTAALFITAPKWIQHNYSPTDEWTDKMWNIHIMEFCSAIKKELSADMSYKVDKT